MHGCNEQQLFALPKVMSTGAGSDIGTWNDGASLTAHPFIGA
jgi:hypothetical protein